MKEKEDIRVTKTKRDLCNALIELIQNTPFKKITVGDICSAAMVNKMTFYKHYADKYELLNDVLLNFKKSVLARAEETLSEKDGIHSMIDLTIHVLNAVIDECRSKKQMLIDLAHDDMVITMISTTIEKSINELLTDINKNHAFKYGLDTITAAVTGATTFLIRYWFIHDQTINKTKFLEQTKQFLCDLFDSKILFVS